MQANYVAGCTGNYTTSDGATTTLASNSVCQCSYAVYFFHVPYDDNAKTLATYQGYSGQTFLAINDTLKKDASKFNDTTVVPQNIAHMLNDCKTSNGTSQPAVPAGVGTTVAS